jgi:hypothetical protein
VILKLPYKKYPDSTTGGFFYAAALPINIALPQKNAPRTKRFEAIIDSGATVCQFQASIGRFLGLDIEKGEAKQTMGVAGPTTMYMHEIALYLPGGIITTKAGFSTDLPVPGLLGMCGFFEHFRVSFDPTALRVELERIFKA